MKIYRCGSIYKVGIIEYIKIKYLLMILLLKRQKRRFQIIKKHLKNIIYPLFLLILYLIIISIIGENVFNHSLWQCIWESKELLYTSIVLAVLLPYYDYMKERHKRLEQQLIEYFEVYNECEYIMNSLGLLIDIHGYRNMFWDDYQNDHYYRILGIENSGVINYDLIEIKNLREREIFLAKSIEIVTDSVKKNQYIGVVNKEQFFNNANNSLKKYKEILDTINKKPSKNELTYLMKELNALFYEMLDEIRKPWRWDKKLDEKIDMIILNRDNCLTDYDIVKYRRRLK